MIRRANVVFQNIDDYERIEDDASRSGVSVPKRLKQLALAALDRAPTDPDIIRALDEGNRLFRVYGDLLNQIARRLHRESMMTNRARLSAEDSGTVLDSIFGLLEELKILFITKSRH